MPHLAVIGIVTADLAASLAFYRRLGLEVLEGSDDAPHVEVPLPGGLLLAFDLVSTIRSFDASWTPPSGSPRVALAFDCGSPDAVDRTYADLVAAGAAAHLEPFDAPWGRPLLGVSRAVTRAACAEQGIEVWEDPHNLDPSFTRVRLRSEVLPLLEAVLQGGVASSLARTAAQLREDCDALDSLAEAFAGDCCAVDDIAELPVALRRRVVRAWLIDEGVPELSDSHLRRVDALVSEWRGQGGVWLPGGFVVRRAHGRLVVEPQS